METIKISEIFNSIQGEGKYAGTPMLFIRTSGCNRDCSWCDTKYHTRGKEMTLESIIKTIGESNLDYICWTGGEPLLQIDNILKVMELTIDKKHHLETNGDFLQKNLVKGFDYIGISPKDKNTASKIKGLGLDNDFDIKIVTDLDKVNIDILEYATMLMPLSTYNKKNDLAIQREVWNYCVGKKIKMTPRYQTWIWGKRRKV